MRIPLFAFILLIISCNSKKKTENELPREIQKIKKYEKEYNIVASLDTISRPIYSVDLQELVTQGNLSISDFDVIDITKENNTNYVKIHSYMSLVTFYANIQVTNNQMEEIRASNNPDDIFNEQVFILKINSIEKIDFSLHPQSEDEHIYIELEPNTYGTFILNADLIKIIN